MKPVRTRFAPSPTGYLHVGGIRTALFAWLVARQAGGEFVLRFEDTDKKREVEGSREHLIKSLHTLGLKHDEGPDIGGQFGPYVQSERLASYHKWAQMLIDAGKAYADPYTPEQVQQFREEAQKAKKPFLYRNHRPTDPPKWDGTMPLRFKSEPKDYQWHDAVMGDMHAGAEAIDDFILIKSDGYPTYNFAHIIDDREMQISHIIRGQEFIASQPNYLNLYEALEFEVPILATVPHILGPDGKKKLSKRDGAKDVLDYFREGYLQEAMLNFIASLGWNDGTEQEIFIAQELIEKFSLDRVQRAGAKFDESRLLWMNGTWIRGLNLGELYERSKDFWPESSRQASDDYKKQVLSLIQERLKYFAEIPQLTDFFFTDLPVDMQLIDGNKQLKKFEHAELKGLLEQAKASLEASDFSAADLAERLNVLLEQTGQKPGVLFSLIRIASTQAPSSPGLAETLAVLGQETSLRRIDATLQAL
ncbi:MAG TPA: glutamate--tRNA ligase [Candidatus Saccharimonadales bacterium]|nr:glutamate--tRNA ligase [Candidatus Saccharimonadales bacterium]